MRIKISILFCFVFFAFSVAGVFTTVHIYVLHHHGELFPDSFTLPFRSGNLIYRHSAPLTYYDIEIFTIFSTLNLTKSTLIP